MTTFYAVLGMVAVCGLLWSLTQLGRLAAAPRLAALLGLVLFWAISWPFGMIANTGAGSLGLDRLEARTVEHGLRLVATACLLAFILNTPVPQRPVTAGRHAARVWWWQVATLLLALVALAVNSAWTPPELRDHLAGMANGNPVNSSGPAGSTSIALFFLIENVYYLVAFGIATLWVTQHLRRRPLPPGLRRALRLLWFGSVLLVTATTVLSASALARWVAAAPPPALTRVGLILLSLGLLILVIGLAAPAAGSVAATIRIVRENRATARELEPLWTQLREAFPNELPNRDTGGGDEPAEGRANYTAAAEHAAAPPVTAWLSRRYYRKLIDCRDGLHQLSPYLQKVAGEEPNPTELPTGAQLLAALELRRAGAYDHPGAPVVGDTGDTMGFEDDVQVLVVLSRRLVAAQRSADRALRVSGS